MIVIVDYGLGNVQAFVNIYRRLNIPVEAADAPDQLLRAERLILPGVGAFDSAMSLLESSTMRRCLDELVLVQKRPVLGVCVGMQMMGKRSDEGTLPGLGWIDAEVRRFDENRFNQRTHLPHMGWNNVLPCATDSLFRGIADPRFYFLHSYYIAPNNRAESLAVTDYCGPFTSAVRSDHIFGTQFHPEKSHEWGIQLLKNFAEI